MTKAGSLFTDLPNQRENQDIKWHFEGCNLDQAMSTGRLSSLHYLQSYKLFVNDTGACHCTCIITQVGGSFLMLDTHSPGVLASRETSLLPGHWEHRDMCQWYLQHLRCQAQDSYLLSYSHKCQTKHGLIHGRGNPLRTWPEGNKDHN